MEKRVVEENRLYIFVVILLFLFMITFNSLEVFAAQVTASFTTANELPANSSGMAIQDGFTNPKQCSGGSSFDLFSDDLNMTTHMLNATIRWDEGTDPNGQSIKTFVCVAKARGSIDLLTKKNESGNTKCTVLNAWSEDKSVDNNNTGVILNVNFTSTLAVDYNGTYHNYYGALMAWDGTYGDANRSSIVLFNFTILNKFPTAASALSPTSTHDSTPDLSWSPATDADDGSAPDECPADNISQYTAKIGDSAYGGTDRLNTAVSTNAYTWIATALPYNDTIVSGSTSGSFYARINASDGHTGTIGPNYDVLLSLTNDIPSTASSLFLNLTSGLLNSHSQGPRMNWTASTDTDADTVTYNISASTAGATGPYTLLYSNTTTTAYEVNFFGKKIPWGNIVNEGNWTNKTVYIRIYAYDDKQSTLNEGAYDVTIQLTNRLPTPPTAFNTTTTHDPTPNVAWTAATDADGDTIYYLLKVGATDYGDKEYSHVTKTALSETIQNSTIPWGVAGQATGWNNNTVYISLMSFNTFNTNNYTSAYLNQTMQLTDFLPNVTKLQLSDTVTGYGDCTNSVCTLNPLSYANITLATILDIEDKEQDCNNITPILYLCLNSTALTGCGNNLNANFSWAVDSVQTLTESCRFTFSANITGVNNTPSFFIPSGNYKYHVNVSGLSGNVRDKDYGRNATWVYGTLSSVNYTGAVTLGGATITLGSWSSGNNLYLMTNHGNNIVDIRWNTTYLGQAGNLINWTPDGSDFQIDDDNSQSAETSGKIYPGNLTANDIYFNHSTGLERCVSWACSSAAYNETMDTYYHIMPPLGLPSGTYSGTITYNVNTHNS